MTETVVHVKTLEQWKSVLDIWFEKGYTWQSGDKEYSEDTFEIGGRFLNLDDCITYGVTNHYSAQFLEYSEFMAQQKEDNKMKTYYVTQEQLDLIEELKYWAYPLYTFYSHTDVYAPLVFNLSSDEEKALLRYLGGDETIEFKVKEQLYRLWRTETNDRIYMRINDFGTPIWTVHKDNAFTAPLEEINKWKTPAWAVEKVD